MAKNLARIDTRLRVDLRQASLDAYTSGQRSSLSNLLPEQAMGLSSADTLDILRRRFGAAVDVALSPAHTDLDVPPGSLPPELRDPVADQPDGEWLKRTNMVGINVRTVGSFWNIVKYALTLPDAQDSVHLRARF